ncbi:MAG TPA: PAS domain S-box protein, partial [Prosthecobacter sp.]|nr:PAS domain S-box protein [Prosthecobacter sp.]
MVDPDEEARLRSAALQNSRSILLARRRAEEELARTREELERLTLELRQQTEWLRVTLASIGDAVIAVDTEGMITFTNQAAEALTGWPAQDALGRHFREVMHLIDETTSAPAASPIEAVMDSSQTVGLANHTVLISRNASRIPIDDSAAPIRNAEGTLIGVVMVFHDVSDRRRREKELARSHENFRLLSAVMPHLLWTTDHEGRVDYFNERWYEYTGQTPGSVPVQTWDQSLHSDDRQKTSQAWRNSLAHGTSFEFEARLRRHDGDYRWFIFRAVPLRQADGAIVRWFGSSTDIHERKLTAEALREEALV